ncbi:hypothetical protein IWX49DRAFT_584993 [Phyllosticta citricarpa]|uniref:Secreted protein n=1 Tax=Phyllosticta citricarpa TaxID=55181 RepID=A0ABR1L5Q3_9PEZI
MAQCWCFLLALVPLFFGISLSLRSKHFGGGWLRDARRTAPCHATPPAAVAVLAIYRYWQSLTRESEAIRYSPVATARERDNGGRKREG